MSEEEEKNDESKMKSGRLFVFLMCSFGSKSYVVIDLMIVFDRIILGDNSRVASCL